MKNTKRRYCTVPNIPFFRDWYVARYNDVCQWHDEQYEMFRENKPYTFHELLWRFESDVQFVKAIIRKYRNSKIHAKMGHALFAILHLPFAFIPNNVVYILRILYAKIKKMGAE